MNAKERLAEREYDSLDVEANNFMLLVQSILKKIRKEEVRLWLSQKDKYKLLKLRVWAEKYFISIEYILQTLLPFWESFVQRRSKRMKRSGLNVRVSTLTGKKSEEILLEKVKKDFPDNLNKVVFKAKDRERLFQLSLGKDMKVKTKNLFDYTNPKKYVAVYRKAMKSEYKEREAFELEMKKRPYRGNPFTQEVHI